MKATGIAIPHEPGIYALLLVARHEANVEVGRLGTVQISAGRAYVYVGSALNGLARRLGRYLATSIKNKHWHIDHVIEHLDLVAIYIARTEARLECDLSLALHAMKEHFTPIIGFGNSDCQRCSSHFFECNTGDNHARLDTNIQAAFLGCGLELLVVNVASELPRLEGRGFAESATMQP